MSDMMNHSRSFWMTKAFAITLLLVVAVPGSHAVEPNFETDVWPYFKAHCLKCHSAEKQESDLGVTSQAR